MPPGGKKPLKRVRTSRFDSTLSESHNFTPSLERTQDNLDTLHRGLILPQATYKYTRIADDEISLLHILPADDKRDMLHTELRTAKSDYPLLHYVALSYTWNNEEPTEKLWIRKPESWRASPPGLVFWKNPHLECRAQDRAHNLLKGGGNHRRDRLLFNY